jgi:hypothetical protein
MYSMKLRYTCIYNLRASFLSTTNKKLFTLEQWNTHDFVHLLFDSFKILGGGVVWIDHGAPT